MEQGHGMNLSLNYMAGGRLTDEDEGSGLKVAHRQDWKGFQKPASSIFSLGRWGN